MRRFCCAVLCILLLLPGGGAPLGALVDGAGGGAFTDAPTANGTDAAGAGKVLSEQATDLPTKVLTLPELYEKVKVARQSLLESRLEVVRLANEAKRRLEEILAGGDKPADAAANESLKKDLETIREAQRLLTTILSDITAAAIQSETAKDQTEKSLTENSQTAKAQTGENQIGAGQIGAGQIGESQVGTDQVGAGQIGESQTGEDTARAAELAAPVELPLSRDYLEFLVGLYTEKNGQLTKVIASLGEIVVVRK